MGITGKSTRKNPARKVWVLVIICLYSKACTMVLMRDYSAEAFKMSMTSHFFRYGRPCVLTADNGSQIRASAADGTQVQSGQTLRALSGATSCDLALEKSEPGIYDWASGARGFFKDTLIFLAPTEAQHRSGSIEAHVKLMKNMLRSSMRCIKKQSLHPFSSIFQLDLILSKITGLLNSRPIFSSDSGLYTIADILQPRMSTAKNYDIFEDDIVKIFQIFVEELISGNLSKPGKTSFTDDPTIKIGSVVMILFPSRNLWKYGRVEKQISMYRYQIQLKLGRTFQGHQVVDRCNIIVLFNPPQTKKQQNEEMNNST